MALKRLPSDPNDPYYDVVYPTRKKKQAVYKSPPLAMAAREAAVRTYDLLALDERMPLDSLRAYLERFDDVGKASSLEIIAALGRMLNGDDLDDVGGNE